MADEMPRVVLGENGHAELTARGLGDTLLALFDKVVRGIEEQRLRELTEGILNEARATNDSELVKNLFVLAFHTRWCRGGKGERKIFYQMLAVLFERYADVVVDLVELIPDFGYWKDLLSLLLECTNGDVDYAPLKRKVWQMFSRQLKADMDEFDSATREARSPRNLSLVAKFAPSEGGHHSKALGADKEICKLLFPSLVGEHVADADAAWPTARAKYRRMLSKLRRALSVPEVQMCEQKWAEINFSKVPSLCLDRNKKAFLNEGKARKAEDEDRVRCRERLLEMVGEKGAAALKGKQLFPHELVQQVLQPSGAKRGFLCGDGLISDAVGQVLNAQWETVRVGLLEMVEQRKADLATDAARVDDVDVLMQASKLCDGLSGQATGSVLQDVLAVSTDVAVDSALVSDARKPIGLSRVVCMADVSGSMAGIPMFVAIAMGILTSEVTHSAFRDKVLTFHENPVWHDLSAETTFVDKVKSLAKAPWGGSTDFSQAMGLIAELVRNERLKQGDIPDLLVVSDMQFDEATHGYDSGAYWGGGGSGNGSQVGGEAPSWEISHQKISRLFHEVGMQVHGHPLEPPNIIFWNVRSDTAGYPAEADQKGVMLLSGYSPALMKFVLSGEMEEERITLDENGNVTKTKVKVDPRETLHRVLHDSGLEAVRALLDEKPPSTYI